MTRRRLQGGVDASGRPCTVVVDDATGLIVEVSAGTRPNSAGTEPDSGDHAGTGPNASDMGTEIVDCRGLVILPAAAEPHVHLDKVATIREAPNPSGELMGAVRAWLGYAPSLGFDDVHARAMEAVDVYVACGATAIRTNVNLHTTIDPDVLRAILTVRDDVADRCTVQVVGMFMSPLTGDSDAAVAMRRLAEDACELGIDAIGGAPVSDADPFAAVDHLAGLAVRWNLPIDLHIDETLDPSSRNLLIFADAVERHGLRGRATAGHCVSLGMHDVDEQHATAARLAAVGVAVVALPTTNLWLQGRGHPTATPRGLTAVRTLLDAGVLVATGADNIEDPFCPLGRTDPFDAARLLALTTHLSPAEAWQAASTSARKSMGLPANDLAPGAAADLVAIAGSDLDEALAKGSARRMVVRAGAVIASTETVTDIRSGERAAAI